MTPPKDIDPTTPEGPARLRALHITAYRETEYGSPPTRGPWTPTTVLVCLGCYLLLLWAVEVLP